MITESTTSELRETGIRVIGEVPWGTHFCCFYETKQDLLETLVLYFKAGLESKEFCVWVLSHALTVEEAKQALGTAVPDLERHLAQGALEIHSHDEWYVRDGRWDSQRVLQSWGEKLSHTSTNGYAGLRAAGDGGWVQSDDWMAFREYEDQVNLMIADQRSIILCTYPLTSSPGDQVFDVAHIHQLAVARRNGDWETVETPALKQAKAEINRLNQELEQKVEERTTELRRVNEELRAEIAERKLAEMQSRTLADAIPHQIWSGPGDGTLDYCNKRWRSYMGLEQEDLTGYGWQNMVHPDDRERVLKAWHESVSNGTPYQQEKRHRGADGTYRWFLSLGVPLRDPEGRIVRWYGTNTDIEDRKRAEEALRESEARFRRLLSSNIIGVVFWNRNGEIREANDLFLETIGYTREDLCRGEIDWKKLTPPEYAAKDAKAIDELLATGTCTPFEKEYVRKDGERVAVLVGSALFDVEKQAGTSFILDITERKQNEERLRESETRFRQLAENISQIFWLADPDATRVHYVSPAYEEIWGSSCASLRANPASWMDSIHPEDRERIAEEERLQLLTGQHDHTYRIVRPDSSIRWIRDRAFPVRDESGNLIRIAGIAEDITERKQNEERLREYEKVVEGLEEMIVVVDRDYRYLLANRAFLKYRGVEWEDLVGHLVPELLAEGVFENVVKEKLDECLRGNPVQYEMKYCYPQHGERDLLISYFPIEGRAGIDRVACVLQDITERKKAEAALRESETRFRQIAENIEEMFWITDLKGSKTIYMSPAYERITGRSCESLYAAPKSWREDIHPEDRLRMEATFASDPGSTGDYSYRIVRPDGSIRWIRDRGFPVRDESGEVVRFAGIAEDITASKCAEKELQQVNEQLRVLSRRLFHVRDEERRHLARELHDEIGQTLTAAKINLDSIGRSGASDQTSRLNETITILDKLLRQVRQISLDLHPSLLDDLGLAPALRSLLDQQARRAGLRAQFSAVEPLANITRGIQITGFRIAQEAITNILRHANAGFVSVHLRTETDELRMKIVDDGRGFDPAEIEGRTCSDRGFGLMGMRERAGSVGGRVQIVSSPGMGTTVEVSLPLNGSGHGQSG